MGVPFLERKDEKWWGECANRTERWGSSMMTLYLSLSVCPLLSWNGKHLHALSTRAHPSLFANYANAFSGVAFPYKHYVVDATTVTNPVLQGSYMAHIKTHTSNRNTHPPPTM